jgi:hypothetical protein
MRPFFCMAVAFCLPASLAGAAVFGEANFTQVINTVSVTPPGGAARAADVHGILKAEEVLKTGQQSRAEIQFPDQTLTRIGANAVFSFEPGTREIQLQSGTVLFHSPTGKGGGTVKTAGASAGVLGTTILVSTTSNGGFKMIVLEGKGKARLANGKTRILNAGQLVFILPNSPDFGPVLNIELAAMVRGSALVNGFSAPLASLPKIEAAIAKQEKQMAQGTLKQTGLLAGDAAGGQIQIVDGNSLRPLFEQEDFQAIDRLFVSDLTLAGGPVPGDFIFTPQDLVLLNGGSALAATFEQNAVSFKDQEIADSIEPALFGGNVVLAQNIFLLHESGSPYIMIPASIGALIAGQDIVLRENSFGFGTANLTTSGDVVLFAFGTFRSESPLGISFHVDGPPGNVFSIFSMGDLNLAPTSSGGFDNPNGRLQFITAGNATMDNLFYLVGELKVTALETATLSNSSFSGTPSFIGIDARTVVLQNINFPGGSEVRLNSANGQLAPNPNTGAAVQPGYVNFISGVQYGANPAELAVGNGITIGTSGN